MIDALVSLILFSAITTALVSLWYEKRVKISPAPTLPWVKREMMKLLKRSPMNHDGIYRIAELGAGWGGLSKALALSYPQASVAAYEVSLAPYLISRLRSLFSKGGIKVRKIDFFKADLSDYDVLICYLSPYHMEALAPQFATLRPGSLILSNSFPILDRTPIDTAETHIGVKIPIFLYRV